MNNEQTKLLAKVVAKAWTDEDFKAKLKTDPKTVLSEEISDINPDVQVVMHENTPNQLNFVLPAKPDLVGLSTDEILARASQIISVQLEMFDIM